MRRLLVSLAHLAAAGLTARAAAAQLVMGRVVDSASRRPLPFVPVRLVRVEHGAERPDTAPVARGRTARDGAFTLAAPGPGTYRLHIADGLAGPPLALASADSVDQHEYPIAPDLARVLFEGQVERQASVRPGTMMLRYPPDLRDRNVEGHVLTQFVVDTTGRAVASTFNVLESTDPGFTQAARAAVLTAEYRPAELAGRKVRQLVLLPIGFTLNRGRTTRASWPSSGLDPFARP